MQYVNRWIEVHVADALLPTNLLTGSLALACDSCQPQPVGVQGVRDVHLHFHLHLLLSRLSQNRGEGSCELC